MKIVHSNGQDKDFFRICEKLDKSLNDNTPGRREAGMNSLSKLEQIKDVFLLYRGGEVIGSAGMWQHDDEWCELVRVFIADECRGRGLAGKLTEKIEKLARKKGYTKIFLRTYSCTPYAVRAYEKLGYKQVQPEKMKYQDTFPKELAINKLRVFMEKEIK
jgi:N-acetylglutamate synthase-like GNAT family acetyltransferase